MPETYEPNLDDLERLAKSSQRETLLTPATVLWLIARVRSAEAAKSEAVTGDGPLIDALKQLGQAHSLLWDPFVNDEQRLAKLHELFPGPPPASTIEGALGQLMEAVCESPIVQMECDLADALGEPPGAHEFDELCTMVEQLAEAAGKFGGGKLSPDGPSEHRRNVAKLEAFDSIEAMVLASEDEEIEPGEVWERVARVLRAVRSPASTSEQAAKIRARIATMSSDEKQAAVERMVTFAFSPDEAEAPATVDSAWTPTTNLPDSDVTVLLCNEPPRLRRSIIGELEFTDDSEGHGKPYWETTSGEMPIEAFTHWRAVISHTAWVRCSDRMPTPVTNCDHDEECWSQVFAPARGVDVAAWDGQRWIWRGNGYAIPSEVTHWAPLLPAPPVAEPTTVEPP